MKMIMKMMMMMMMTMMIHHLKLEDRSFVAGKVEFFHVRARALHFGRKKIYYFVFFSLFHFVNVKLKAIGCFFTVPP